MTAARMLPALTLPADFHWTIWFASLPDDPLTVIACHGVWAVALTRRAVDLPLRIAVRSYQQEIHSPILR